MIRLSILALAGWVLLTVGAATPALSPALAHATKQGTDPADGAVLEIVPEVITLTFDEPTTLTSVQLTVNVNGNESEQRLDPPRQTGQSLIVEAPDLGPGQYTVEWRALSADGHVVSGSFGFQIAP